MTYPERSYGAAYAFVKTAVLRFGLFYAWCNLGYVKIYSQTLGFRSIAEVVYDICPVLLPASQ